MSALGLMAPDDPSLAELGWRMTALEARMAEAAKQTEIGLTTLHRDISSLSFVPRGEYIIEMRAIAEQVKSTHALAMWALSGVVGTPIVGVLITLILRSN